MIFFNRKQPGVGGVKNHNVIKTNFLLLLKEKSTFTVSFALSVSLLSVSFLSSKQTAVGFVG
jgi:hypothetical protein